MADLLSDEWLDACNAALADAPPHEGRPLIVTELVPDAPEGRHRAVTLVADDEGVRLVAGERADALAWLVVGVEDAEALHHGRLEPARALADGRIRVRGDLRSVVEATGTLAAAHERLRTR